MAHLFCMLAPHDQNCLSLFTIIMRLEMVCPTMLLLLFSSSFMIKDGC